MAFDPNRRGDSEPRRIGPSPYSTSEISETNRDIFEELEIDDIESKAEDDESAWNLPTTALAEKEEAHDPRRLVKVENLAEDATAEHLLEIFKGSSEKLKVYIAVNSDGKRRGYALLSFGTSNEAVIARGKVDRMVLKGEKITCRCRYWGRNPFPISDSLMIYSRDNVSISPPGTIFIKQLLTPPLPRDGEQESWDEGSGHRWEEGLTRNRSSTMG
jgi:RNA recognition motif-containing protein